MVTPIQGTSGSSLSNELISDQHGNKPFAELFITICFLICFLTSLFPNPLLNALVLNAGSAGFLILWVAFRWGMPSQLLMHLACFLGSGLCLYLIAITGGTVSVVMVVFVGLGWLPFLLLPVKAAIAWLIAQFNALLLVFVGSQLGWISTNKTLLTETAYWNLSIKFQALVAMMLVLDHLYRSRQQQIQALQSRGEELEALHLELIRAQSHKDEFIASVGHELRTPMNAILGLNEVLRDEVQDQPQDLKRVELIRKSTQHLLSVVNDILDFSQLQADRMPLHPKAFHIRAFAHELFERFSSQADSKQLKTGFTWSDELPDWIFIDEKRFKQMIDTLLENALKFTHQGTITLRFLTCPMGLRIEVQDTGIGMTDEQAQLAFARFQKSSSAQLKLYGGTGLGLSICDKLVELHGGHMGVQSQFNVGSLFWMELPISPVQAPDESTPSSINTTDSRSPRHFLIVDDHPVNLMVAKRMVEKSWPAANVHTVSSGAEALTFIQHHEVDMILMDMLMPDMDGMAVTRALRSLPAPRNQLPVLGLTASSNPEDLAQCLEAGMNAMVLKPLEQQALEKGVRQCFNESTEQRP